LAIPSMSRAESVGSEDSIDRMSLATSHQLPMVVRRMVWSIRSRSTCGMTLERLSVEANTAPELMLSCAVNRLDGNDATSLPSERTAFQSDRRVETLKGNAALKDESSVLMSETNAVG